MDGMWVGLFLGKDNNGGGGQSLGFPNERGQGAVEGLGAAGSVTPSR